ncbi:hypothetical protein IJ162_02135 [Candidatus Saccharibacteria bacterium]|nr:hypothetical protein [Candidatus Saccharibacteria bacterium]
MNKETKSKKTIPIIAGAIAIAIVVIIIIVVFAIPRGQESDEPINSAGGESSQDFQAKTLKIKQSGWSYIKSDNRGYISYGVELFNLDNSYMASFPKIVCTGKDSEGKILFSYDEIVDFIYPRETIFVGDTFNVDEKPDTIELSVEIANRNWETPKSTIYPKNNSQIVSNVAERKGDFSTMYTGEVENTSDADISNDVITVIFKKDGKIVGGGNGYSDSLNAGQKSTFTIDIYAMPNHDTYELTARIGSLQ